jgi:hypothetical protein
LRQEPSFSMNTLPFVSKQEICRLRKQLKHVETNDKSSSVRNSHTVTLTKGPQDTKSEIQKQLIITKQQLKILKEENEKLVQQNKYLRQNTTNKNQQAKKLRSKISTIRR